MLLIYTQCGNAVTFDYAVNYTPSGKHPESVQEIFSCFALTFCCFQENPDFSVSPLKCNVKIAMCHIFFNLLITKKSNNRHFPVVSFSVRPRAMGYLTKGSGILTQ